MSSRTPCCWSSVALKLCRLESSKCCFPWLAPIVYQLSKFFFFNSWKPKCPHNFVGYKDCAGLADQTRRISDAQPKFRKTFCPADLSAVLKAIDIDPWLCLLHLFFLDCCRCNSRCSNFNWQCCTYTIKRTGSWHWLLWALRSVARSLKSQVRWAEPARTR